MPNGEKFSVKFLFFFIINRFYLSFLLNERFFIICLFTYSSVLWNEFCCRSNMNRFVSVLKSCFVEKMRKFKLGKMVVGLTSSWFFFWLSITRSYMLYINTLKCEYWLDTHSVKVWRRYVLPNTNAAHFCDIFSDIEQFFQPA